MFDKDEFRFGFPDGLIDLRGKGGTPFRYGGPGVLPVDFRGDGQDAPVLSVNDLQSATGGAVPLSKVAEIAIHIF